MSRLTDGLPGPAREPRMPSPRCMEAKLLARRSRSETGTTYERIANATGRALSYVYDQMNERTDRRPLTYADLIALSRNSQTKQFVAHLLQPIEQAMHAHATAPGKPEGTPPDGNR